MTGTVRTLKRSILATAAALLLGVVALEPAIVLAQAKGKPPVVEEEQKGYTLPYFFTLVGILAAVVPVCMACSRKWDYVVDEEDDD